MSQSSKNEEFLISEIKLLLAEKRTYLAMFRTGVAVFGLSVTALGVLIVSGDTSGLSSMANSVLIRIFLIIIAISGGWLMYRSRQKINDINGLIQEIEEQNKRLAEIVI